MIIALARKEGECVSIFGVILVQEHHNSFELSENSYRKASIVFKRVVLIIDQKTVPRGEHEGGGGVEIRNKLFFVKKIASYHFQEHCEKIKTKCEIPIKTEKFQLVEATHRWDFNELKG